MIDSIDFANMYREHKIASTFKGKSATDWDEKAESMSKRVIDSPYTAEFISKMNLDGCESVLDVGCGPGTIALALAPKMHKVCGVDYSTGILDCFMKNAESRGLSSAKCLLRSWEDDWADIEPCDVVVASRSIEVKDLKEALKKLNEKAKKGVYITYKAGGSFVDEEILGYIGK